MSKGENLFPRIDVEKELAALDELQAEARRAALPAVEVEPFAQESVDFDTFCKSDFRAVKVKACESVKRAPSSSGSSWTTVPGLTARSSPASPCTTSRRNWWARPW